MSYFDADRNGNVGGMQNAVPHHGHVAEYQQSCIPYVTSSVTDGQKCERITFPYVTRFIVVSNLEATAGNHIRFGFSEFGTQGEHGSSVSNEQHGDNYFILAGGQSTGRIEIKCKEIWVAGGSTSLGFSGGRRYSVLSGLTNVPSGSFPSLTGSFPSAGFAEGIG